MPIHIYIYIYIYIYISSRSLSLYSLYPLTLSISISTQRLSLPASYSLSHYLFSNSIFSHYLLSLYLPSYSLSLTHTLSLCLYPLTNFLYPILLSLSISLIYISHYITLSIYHTIHAYIQSLYPLPPVPPNWR